MYQPNDQTSPALPQEFLLQWWRISNFKQNKGLHQKIPKFVTCTRKPCVMRLINESMCFHLLQYDQHRHNLSQNSRTQSHNYIILVKYIYANSNKALCHVDI